MGSKDDGAFDETIAPAASGVTVEAATAVDVASSETLAVDARTAASVSETLAAPPSGGPLATGRATLRAGRGEDYHELVPVDPQHYVVGEEIARGGMGRILSARDRRLGRPVAIKELLAGAGEARGRFEREARITAKLQHPAIVSIHEAGAWPSGEPFYVMKLVRGESLDRAIAARATPRSGSACSPTWSRSSTRWPTRTASW